MKIPFINIHTHTSQDSTEIISVYNLRMNEVSNRPINENISLNHYSAGIHPWYIDELNFNEQLQNLEKILLNEKCIFLGECGLDKLKCSDFSIQLKVFISQIEFAQKYHKPMILHCVKAFEEILSLLQNKINPEKVIFHGYHKSTELALNLTRKGYSISLGKIILTHPEKAKDILEKVHPSKLFFETDDLNVSIEEVFLKASQISGKPIEYWKEQLHSNFSRIIVKDE